MIDNTQSFLIKKLLCGMRRVRSKKDVRIPITIQMLQQFPSALRNVAYSNYESTLFSTAFVCSFFGFLRVGEIAVDAKHSDITRVLQIDDVKFSESECFLTIRFSKTDQYGASVTLTLSKSCYQEICPYKLLRRYISLRPSKGGPLFCHLDGEPMTKYQFRYMLRKCLIFLNIDSNNIKSHSFRIGAATTASQLNIPDEMIMQMGRWSPRSNNYKKYIRLEKIIP